MKFAVVGSLLVVAALLVGGALAALGATSGGRSDGSGSAAPAEIRADTPAHSVLPPAALPSAAVNSAGDGAPPASASPGYPPGPGVIKSSFPVGAGNDALAYDTENGDLYVANVGENTVSVVNGTSPLATVPVGGSPDALTFDSGTQYVFVSNFGSGNVTVINGTTLVATIPTGAQPASGTYDPGNGFVYVPDNGSNAVSVIHGTVVVATLGLGEAPISAVYDSANGDVYIANQRSDNVSVVHGTSVLTSVRVDTGPRSMVYDPNNGYVYVVNVDSDTVSVISGTNLLGTVSVGTQPSWTGTESAAYDTQDGDVYVANYGSENVSVISGTRVIATVAVGSDPTGLAYDNETGYVYTGGTEAPASAISGTHLSYEYSRDAGGYALAGPIMFTLFDGVDQTVYLSDAYGAVYAVSAPEALQASLSLLSASPPRIYQDLAVDATASAGYPAYTVNVSGLPPGCPTSPGPGGVVSCSLTQPGNYSVHEMVTDFFGARANASMMLTVVDGLSIQAFNANPSQVTVDKTLQLHVSLVGGSSAVSYLYRGLPAGCSSSNVSTLACTPALTGRYVVSVNVRDQFGVEVNASVSVTVVAFVDHLEIAGFNASPENVALNHRLTLGVDVVGATGPGVVTFTYSSLPPGCEPENKSQLSCTPSEVGNFTVSVKVSDQFGTQLTAYTHIMVSAATSSLGSRPPPPSGDQSNPSQQSPALPEPLLVGLVAAVAAAIIVGVLIARRRGKQPPPAHLPPPPPARVPTRSDEDPTPWPRDPVPSELVPR